MVSWLNKMPGVECVEPEGAFYAFPAISGFASSLEAGSYLLEEADVAVVPGEAFGLDGYARLSYALADDDLELAMQRMSAALDARA
jgi:aspartate/methionine/tyrosine aminotransferase